MNQLEWHSVRAISAKKPCVKVSGSQVLAFIGALSAQAMGNPAAWGLDAAVPAAFLGLVWPRLTATHEKLLAISAVALSLILTPFVAAGIPIISTTLLAVIFGWRQRP
jgi:predicted branched-subunit amino acid permease